MSEVGRKVLRDTKFLLVDATFQICQKPHEQLLTIHAQVKRSEDGVRVNMPVAFALMHNRSESAYKAVFQKIKDIVEEDGSSLRVKEFIVDYEKAICFGQPIRTTNIVESWNSSIYKAGKRKKHDIYQLAILLARENARCEANVNQYGAKKYKRRRQVEKEKGIKKAYDVYDTNLKLWELLERLREATTNTIRYPIAVDEQE